MKHVVRARGLTFSLVHEGSKNAQPVLFLHGFTGSGGSWCEITRRLGPEYRALCPDLIGHADSDAPAHSGRYTMDHAVYDLAEMLDELSIMRSAVVGYSMGGRLALHFALEFPDRTSALVLESASYGLADPSQREARRRSDEALADWIEEHGIEDFAQRWAGIPLFQTQTTLSERLRGRQHAERRSHTPRGLANSLRGMGTGAQNCLWDRLAELPMPVLLVAGALDAKFQAHAQEMEPQIPQARVHIAEDAGHNVHLEQPEWFAGVLNRFLTNITHTK